MRRVFIMAAAAVAALSTLNGGCTRTLLYRVRFAGTEHLVSENDARVLRHYEARVPAGSAREQCAYWRAAEEATRQRTDLTEQAHRLLSQQTQAGCKRARDEQTQAEPQPSNNDVEPTIEVAARRLMSCDADCARELRTCVQGPGRGPEREVCVATYRACQVQCEAEFNAAGFCVERNILTGRPTGAVGPCP